MNSDSDISLSESPVDTPHASSKLSLQFPFALLTSAIAVVMIAQTVSTFKQRSALREGRVQLADALKKREVVVKQSIDLQTKFQDLIMGLLILAKTDDEAKQIIAKYNIRQRGESSAPAETPGK